MEGQGVKPGVGRRKGECQGLSVPDLARHVVTVQVRVLEEHMETPLVLCQRMTCYLVHESLQTRTSLLNEILLVNAVITTEWHLSLESLAWQSWHYYLTIPLQLVPQPFEVRISPPHTRLLHTKHRQVCLESALVVCVPLVAHPVGDRVYYINFQEVCRHSVGVIQGLLFTAQSLSPM